MERIMRSWELPVEKNVQFFIVEEDCSQFFKIEESYRKKGVSEGWLILFGWKRDPKNNLILYYEHI